MIWMRGVFEDSINVLSCDFLTLQAGRLAHWLRLTYFSLHALGSPPSPLSSLDHDNSRLY